MAFTKDFFAELDAHIEEYRKHFWTNVVTVSIKAYQREFNLKRLVQCGDDLLTFAYCDAAKQRELPDKVQEEIGETHAFPALTVPYGSNSIRAKPTGAWMAWDFSQRKSSWLTLAGISVSARTFTASIHHGSRRGGCPHRPAELCSATTLGS